MPSYTTIPYCCVTLIILVYVATIVNSIAFNFSVYKLYAMVYPYDLMHLIIFLLLVKLRLDVGSQLVVHQEPVADRRLALTVLQCPVK